MITMGNYNRKEVVRDKFRYKNKQIYSQTKKKKKQFITFFYQPQNKQFYSSSLNSSHYSMKLSFLCSRTHHSNNFATILTHIIVRKIGLEITSIAQKSSFCSKKSQSNKKLSPLPTAIYASVATAYFSLSTLSCTSVETTTQYEQLLFIH